MPEVAFLYYLLLKGEMDVAGINQATDTFKKNVGPLRGRADVIVQEQRHLQWIQIGIRGGNSTLLQSLNRAATPCQVKWRRCSVSDHLTLYKFVRPFPEAELLNYAQEQIRLSWKPRWAPPPTQWTEQRQHCTLSIEVHSWKQPSGGLLGNQWHVFKSSSHHQRQALSLRETSPLWEE